MRFLTITISFLLIFSGLTANEDFDRFLKCIGPITKATTADKIRIKSIIELLNKVPVCDPIEESEPNKLNNYSYKHRNIAVSLSCQLAVEINQFRKKVLYKKMKYNVGIDDNIEFCLKYLNYLEHKYCPWIVELESM